MQKIKARLLELDFLRGIAILLVLGVHVPVPWEAAGVFRPMAGFFIRFGWTGVDLFFVLSGFLITGLILSEFTTRGRFLPQRFLLRRVFKIWPSYYLFLLVMLLVGAIRAGELGGAFVEIRSNFFHYQNYVMQPLGHTWSLAIEEHFYVLLPLVIAGAMAISNSVAQGARLVALVAVAIMLICTMLRCVFLWHAPFMYITHMQSTHLRIDGLFCGVLLSYLMTFRAEFLTRFAKKWIWLLLAGAILLLPAVIFPRNKTPFVYTIGYTLIYLGFAFILCVVVRFLPQSRWGARFLDHCLARGVGKIGMYSFTIYLWHVPIAGLVQATMVGWQASLSPSWYWLLATSLFVLLSLAVGVLASKFIERPVLNLREWLLPEDSRISAVPSIKNGSAR